MVTTTKSLSETVNDDDKPKDAQAKNDGLIDTTGTAEAKASETEKDLNDKKEKAKLDKDALLEQAKAKREEATEPTHDDGLVDIFIPYPATGLQTEKITIGGETVRVHEAFIDGKKHTIPVNRTVRVPKEVKELIYNTTHHGGAVSKPNEVIYGY